MNYESFNLEVATEAHIQFAQQICDEMETSSKQRGTGISKRSPEQIIYYIRAGKAVIALTSLGEWAGFCYIESWDNDEYISNSGLIVAPSYRKSGLARKIKNRIFKLSKSKFPHAKMFGLTTSAAVMKINSELGYEPVVYSELTSEEKFWQGCSSCVNYDILQSKGKKNCLCTAMLFDPLAKKNQNISSPSFAEITS
ncbi:MAG: GNAT family N-acetyltransferase [Bacteroidetes bacterium]|nr:GNAT family N-acetyltransferase [Bacteroidota bacterium]